MNWRSIAPHEAHIEGAHIEEAHVEKENSETKQGKRFQIVDNPEYMPELDTKQRLDKLKHDLPM